MKNQKNQTLTRLVQLIVMLQGDRCPNARELAENCEVSRRTIHRDLDRLEEAGIPIQYHVQKQGYCLSPSFGFAPPNLSEREALSLLIASKTAPGLDELGLEGTLRTGADKLIRMLPATTRARASSIVESMVREDSILTATADRKAIHGLILEALASRRQVRLTYRDPERGDRTTTKLGIYRFLLMDSEWCLMGRSSLHRGVELFRTSWLEEVRLTDDPCTIPPRFQMGRHLGKHSKSRADRAEELHEVQLRLNARAAMQIPEVPFDPCQWVSATEEDGVLLSFQVASFEKILGWVLSLGTGVEVLGPRELRENVRETALAMALRQSDSPLTTSEVA